MRKIILSTLIFCMTIPIVQSQVTIGSGLEPGKAALLDMKTKPADGDNVTVDVNKPGGLVLPRVQLQSESTLDPFIDSGTAEWTNQTNKDNNSKVHTGMMVYNLTNNSTFKPGIYFWNGEKWVAAKGTDTSVTADNGLTKTAGDIIQLGGNLKQNTTVTPSNNNLDFSGALKIQNTPTPANRIFLPGTTTNIPAQSVLNKIATLGINTETGEVVTMKASNDDGESTKALNYIEYRLVGEGDWIQNFETKISSVKYTLLIVGFRFIPYTPYSGIRVGQRLKPAGDPGAITGNFSGTNYGTSTYPKSPVVNVYADRYRNHSNGTIDGDIKTYWYIHADYLEAEPDDRLDGTWIINCLVINNSMVNFYPTPISYGPPPGGITGTSNIQAGGPPAGLPDHQP